jgi:hypothetical protein
LRFDYDGRWITLNGTATDDSRARVELKVEPPPLDETLRHDPMDGRGGTLASERLWLPREPSLDRDQRRAVIASARRHST